MQPSPNYVSFQMPSEEGQFTEFTRGEHGTLICDLDGTLLRQNLERSFLKYLLRTNRLRIVDFVLIPLMTPVNLIFNALDYGSLFKVWTSFLGKHKERLLIDHFLADVSDQLTINGDVLKHVKAFEGETVLLTGSYEPLVERFLEQKGIRRHFDAVIGTTVHLGGMLIKRHPYGRQKVRFLRGQVSCTGLANDYSDRHYLGHCTKAIIVGGNRKLEELARRKGWERVR